MNKYFIYVIMFNLNFLLYSFPNRDFETKKSNQTKSIHQTKEKYLIGRWIIPHNADVNITFNTDGTFVFVDFNLKTYKEEILKGKYLIEGSKLMLCYFDRAKQSFTYYQGKSGDSNYYIKKEGYYFVKAD